MIHNLLIIPILGAAKNYVKYKKFNINDISPAEDLKDIAFFDGLNHPMDQKK